MEEEEKKMMKIKQEGIHAKLVFSLLDAVFVLLCGFLAILFRYDFSFGQALESRTFEAWLHYLPAELAITLLLFFFLRMYRFVWHSVDIYDVLFMAFAVVSTFAVNLFFSYLWTGVASASIAALKLLLELLTMVGMRCSIRAMEAYREHTRKDRGGDRIMLVGAGAAGQMLVREIMSSSHSTGTVCCVIDDNPTKWGKYVSGVCIVGGRNEIPEAVKKYEITKIVLAMPSVDHVQQEEILKICHKTDARVCSVPGLYQIVNGEVTLDTVRDVRPEELLGRDSVELDGSKLDQFLCGRVVLVTGGGGSIGSELCRQIAKHNPKELIVLDIYENNAYDIQQELRLAYGDKLNLRVEIASVRDKEKIYELFDRLRPELVFHAAAHKHVPLMEHNPEEAVKNNIFGTYHVVRAAEKFSVKKFVMISTDKAVNPTNFMGATKRFCEMILQSRFDSPTEYCCVRFGNVLGSNGSVIPLFKRQIAEGGPVTITDKRIIRYFMTIPEAARLVLEAGAMAKQSQIFVLDMGEPVKILTLAENLIRLSGLEPYKDIEIKEIGLRPGEKLYEELLMASNDLDETENKKIFVEQQKRIDPKEIEAHLKTLDEALEKKPSPEELIALLRRIVPTYKDPKKVNRAALEADSEHAERR